jgi:ribosomal protein L12E/L44/L45/RPP1/RPP2
MLRAVPDGRRVAEILARALAAAAAPAAAAQAAGGQPADAAPEPVTRPLATAAA